MIEETALEFKQRIGRINRGETPIKAEDCEHEYDDEFIVCTKCTQIVDYRDKF